MADAVEEMADPWVLVRGLALNQAGVVTRSQALGCGLSDEMLNSLIRSRRWRRVHPGVYVIFTGPLPWAARVWSAVLVCGSGAVVSGCCALRLYGMRLDHADNDPVHISVDRLRRVKSHEGVILHRVSHLAHLTHPGRRPPVMRFEHAVLQHAVGGGLVTAIGVLADSCQQRLTTPGRLVLALRAHKRLPMRKKLLEIIEDVALWRLLLPRACLSPTGGARPWTTASHSSASDERRPTHLVPGRQLRHLWHSDRTRRPARA